MSDRHFKFWPDHSRQHLDAPATNRVLQPRGVRTALSGKPGLVFYDTPIGFAEIHDEAQRIAGFLEQRCGVRKGDRVLLYMQNSPQFVIAYYGILRANAVVVPLNPMYLTQEFLRCAKDAGTTTAIVSQELYPRIEPLLDSRELEQVIVAAYSDYLKRPTNLSVPEFVAAPRVELARPGVTLWSDALASGLPPGPLSAGPDDLCVMPYTSGTTGEPRGCMHTHRTTMHTLVASMRWFTMQPELTLLAVAPFFHVTGMQGSMNGPLYNGNTVVLLPRWDRVVAAECVQRYRIAELDRGSDDGPGFLLEPEHRALRSVLDPQIERRRRGDAGRRGAAAAAPGHHLLRRLWSLGDHGGHAHQPPGSCEAAMPGHPDLRRRFARRRSRDRRRTAAGEVGEIVTHGPQVFLGYWNKPQDSAQAFIEIDGKRFLRTGDLGRVDEDGYFFMVDRLKRMINASGFKVWPTEVESLMYQHPAVLEACVIGASDAHRGETVKALVVLRPEWQGRIEAAGDRRLVPREHGGVQGPEDRRIHRCAAQVGQRQDSVARTPGSRTAGRSRAQRRGRARWLSMRALLSRRPGGPETLELDEIPEPVAGPGEVRVAVRACGVNFPDLLIIQDLYQVKRARPFAPGGEISGIVDALGAGVEGLRVGDRVLMSPVQGGMAQKVVGPAGNCWKIPDAMPFDEAAALLLTYGTSQHALKDRAQLKPGETLLVLGAGGRRRPRRGGIGQGHGRSRGRRGIHSKRSSRSRANMAPMRPCNTRRLRSTKPLRARSRITSSPSAVRMAPR